MVHQLCITEVGGRGLMGSRRLTTFQVHRHKAVALASDLAELAYRLLVVSTRMLNVDRNHEVLHTQRFLHKIASDV